VQINHQSFNDSTSLFEGKFRSQWDEVSAALSGILLHLKASDKAGIQGHPIFDPVGTNQAIKNVLISSGWRSNILIREEFKFLGTDIDFEKGGLLVEVQCSNYPFLLNNLLRSELFFKAKVCFSGPPIEAVLIITKAHMFPASNSTLYYEQAVSQMSALAANKVFEVPMRVVGLFEEVDRKIKVHWTEYHNSRYSRTVVKQQEREAIISGGRSAQSRCHIEVK